MARQIKEELLCELDGRLSKSELIEEDWVFIARTLMITSWRRDGRSLNGEQEAVLLRCCERGIEPLAGKPDVLAKSGSR